MTHEDHAIETQTVALANQGKGYQDEEYEPQTQMTVFTGNPTQVMEQMTTVVRHVAKQIDTDKFIADIRGKKYPKVEWWTTVGASLGLFPVVVWSKRLKREDEVAYESRVEVHRQGQLITAGEAICSSAEKSWNNRDEYAIKSMSITRATGKAYRIGLSMIAVMSGLEGTPAEEMPVDTPNERPQQPRTRSNHERRTNTPPAPDRALETDKPWLNQYEKRGSTKVSKEWLEVEENLQNGTWSMADVLDRYKLSKANKATLDRMATDGNKATVVEGFPADDPEGMDQELPFDN